MNMQDTHCTSWICTTKVNSPITAEICCTIHATEIFATTKVEGNREFKQLEQRSGNSTEALTSCVPVLCSTECGASEIVRSDQGKCIPVNASTEIWGRAAAEFLDKPQRQSSYSRSWCRVADEYQELYTSMLSESNS